METNRIQIVPNRFNVLKRVVDRTQLVTVLGSTGSIGCSTLEIVRAHPNVLSILGLSAGNNVELLANQIFEFAPQVVALAGIESANRLTQILSERRIPLPEILHGAEGISQLAADPRADTVVAAIVGIAGLRGVLAALHSKKRVALANKESLVCAPHLVARELQKFGGEILPVDSEHSAIFQALQGEVPDSLQRIILTASGGPFLNRDITTLYSITPAEAVRHPRWSMGPKISVDSATLMNKTLEVIEAAWLFGLDESQISVLVHPESIIHSLIELRDGSQIAQLSVPDMRGAIAYALTYPGARLPGLMPILDLAAIGALNFVPCDEKRFFAIALGREVLRAGGALPAVLNIANEVAVELFLTGKIRFDQIVSTVAEQLVHFSGRCADSLEDLEALCAEVAAETRTAAK